MTLTAPASSMLLAPTITFSLGTPTARSSRPLAVEVAGRQAETEVVPRLGRVGHVRRVLVQIIHSETGVEAARAAVDNVDGTRIRDGPHVFEGDADGQIISPVAVEIAGGQREAEEVARLGKAAEARESLGDLDRCADVETVRSPHEDHHLARAGRTVDRGVGDADGEVLQAVAVEVAGGKA